MKINSLSNNINLGKELPVEIKVGETYSAVVIEKRSNHEAIVQIKGKEYPVKFEGEIPTESRITVQVTGMDEGIPLVRRVTYSATGEQVRENEEITKWLKQMGLTSSATYQQIVQLLKDYGIQINRNILDTLQRFFSTSTSTDQQKMETIRALLNKNLDIHLPHLVAIDAALHGKSMAEWVTSILAQSDSERGDLIQNKRLFSSGQSFIDRAEYDKGTDREETPDLERDVTRITGMRLHTIEGTQKSESIYTDTDSQNLNHRSSFAAGTEHLSIVEGTESEKIQTITHAVQQLLEEVMNELQYDFPHLPSKEYIVTEVTRKLAEVTQSFKNVQREINRNLEHILDTIAHTKGNPLPQIKHLLENTIDIIDKTILKSDIMLFTDMKTEKALLQSSSQLAEARRLLSKGDLSGAKEMIDQVKSRISHLLFQPTEVKVRHYLIEPFFQPQRPEKEHIWAQHLERLIPHLQPQEPSARNAFELIRALGLNYDSEVAQQLAFPSDRSQHEENATNLKAILLNLQNREQEQAALPRLYREAEQALHHITGQQLLSKNDASSNVQSMFFNIPLLLGKEAENIKVFINSKKEGQKIDWENCSLYFLIETKKFGETGILIKSTERNLSITLKNDKVNFRDRVEPLVAKYKERLKEIGYNIQSVQYAKLTPEELQQKQAKTEMKPDRPPQAYTSMKGFDIKI